MPNDLARSPERLSRDNFDLLFGLSFRQPWLKEKQVALGKLISECDTHAQQILVCELLDNFRFLDWEEYVAAIQDIADWIQATKGFVAPSTTICATDNSKYADSSQMVAYSLKSADWQSDAWDTTSFVNGLSKIAEAPERPKVVLVDEFIGTGESAIKAINWLKGDLQNKGVSVDLHLAVIAAMESGKAAIENEGIEVFAVHVLKRGISDRMSGSMLESAIAEMTALESTLGPTCSRGKIARHHLGYKQTEALYGRVKGNTPNNVFPVFWWPFYLDGSQRTTILKSV